MRREAQWLDKVVGAVGRGKFFILLIMASNLGAAMSIAKRRSQAKSMLGNKLLPSNRNVSLSYFLTTTQVTHCWCTFVWTLSNLSLLLCYTYSITILLHITYLYKCILIIYFIIVTLLLYVPAVPNDSNGQQVDRWSLMEEEDMLCYTNF